MSRPIFEVIATSAEDAVAAVSGGADRLELVTEMHADGLTVPVEVFRRIREAVQVPLRVMLRLQDGFAPGDLDRLRSRARLLRAEGAEEFVLGFLTPSGEVDLDAVRAVLDAVPGCRWTFHRALDHAADRHAARAAVAGLPGLDTFLTAGSAAGVESGLEVLAAEAGTTGGQQLLVGGGLRAEHVPGLRAVGLDAFHVGGAVRVAGWESPVDAHRVRIWRDLIDAPVPATV
ncbi:copper homeostasis protein CutC [Peterkaempfera bronchialis]|uniref:Copper homeostasis protein cutC homolog n=1 Tax=Peterkaempfera bronchialis TaxID=2126346 RepID=A0A345SWV0_9ACTN|nr:copper homeostasis protein CutC [Peterkaempfera bronchialis]AXI78205.1 copper homeostasis protein CutC [Peterkaempfera bronchialis]